MAEEPTQVKPRIKAYSYLRFSTPEQLKGDSKRRQTALAKTYAEANQLDLDDKLTLHDLGISAFRGANVETGQLGAFLEAVRNGIVEPGSYLLVESLDRVSRRAARKAVRVLEDIVEAGITVVTLNDGKRYTEESLDGTDFLIAIIILIRANEESETKSKRLRAAWAAKRTNAGSKPLTSLVPGWIVKRGDTLELLEDRAEIVRGIFERFLAGHGRERIVRDLNERGVDTWGSGAKKGTRWHRSYISKILNNRAVLGEMTPHLIRHEGGRKVREALEPVRGYYPQVIDPDTFRRAQDLIAKAGSGRGRHAGKAVRALLAGLAACPLCGSTMTRVSKGSRSKAGRPYYVCVKARDGDGCQYHAVRVDVVEQTLRASPVELIADAPASNTGLGDAIADHEGQLLALTDSIGRLVDELQRAPSDAVSKRLRALEEQQQAVEGELAALREQAEREEHKIVTLKLATLRAALEAEPFDLQAANVALRQSLNRVVIDYRSGFLELHWQHGGVSSTMFRWPQEGQRVLTRGKRGRFVSAEAE
jgi:DNA invertase Pin-like site-specific DNA recombinase